MSIYLDYNASAPLVPAARQAVWEAMQDAGNPASVHRWGRYAWSRLEAARRSIASLVGAREREVIFTSGASEANAQVVQTFVRQGAFIVRSAIEHDSVIQNAPQAMATAVSRAGAVEIEQMRQMLQQASDNQPSQLKLVTVMAANNETGVLQPIAEIVRMAREHGALVHVDATQAVGRVPVHFAEWGVDYLTFSSHKLGGPPGVGALLVKEGRPLEPLIRGGGQEQGRRAGTQNVPAIAGFAVALQQALQTDWGHVRQLRDALEDALQTFLPHLKIYGQEAPRLPNTSCIRMPGVDSEVQVMAFDMEGIAVSAGSACSSGKVKASHVVHAMDDDPQAAKEAIRVSLGPNTTQEEVSTFISAWQKLYSRTHRRDAETAASAGGACLGSEPLAQPCPSAHRQAA